MRRTAAETSLASCACLVTFASSSLLLPALRHVYEHVRY